MATASGLLRPSTSGFGGAAGLGSARRRRGRKRVMIFSSPVSKTRQGLRSVGPYGPEEEESGPEVAGVVLGGVGVQQGEQLLLVGFLPVVLLLAGDVTAHPVGQRLAHGEGAVAFLPGEDRQVRELAMNPARRVCL